MNVVDGDFIEQFDSDVHRAIDTIHDASGGDKAIAAMIGIEVISAMIVVFDMDFDEVMSIIRERCEFHLQRDKKYATR